MNSTRAYLLAGVLTLAACDQFRGAEHQLARAEALLSAGDYSESLVYLRTVVEKIPSNGRAHLLLAKAQWLQGDADSAAATLDVAAAAKADPILVAELRAEIALAQGKSNELLRNLDSGKVPLPEMQRLRYRAQALLGERRPVEAMAVIDGLLRTDQSTADLHLIAAECHAMLGREALARQQVDLALAANSNSARAWLMRSVLLRASASKEAQSALQRAIMLAPGQLWAPDQVAMLLDTANTAINAQDVEAATRAHAGLLRLAPQAPVTTLIGAQAYVLRGNNAEATSDLQRLIQQAPEFLPARAAVIGTLLASERYELALQELSTGFGGSFEKTRVEILRTSIKAAAAAKQGSEDQALHASAAAAGLEQLPAARQIVDRALKVHPESIALTIAKAQLLLRSRQFSRALQLSEALNSRVPDNIRVIAALAEAQFADRDFAAAARSYESLWAKQRTGQVALLLAQARTRANASDSLEPLMQWLTEHPEDNAVRIAYASGAQQLGQLGLAAGEYERVIAQHPRNMVALNNLAWIYHQRGDKRALSIAKRAYDAGANVSSVADTYGWLLADSGNAQAAIPILRSAVQADPGSPVVRYHLAVALIGAGAAEQQEARALLADLLRDDRPFEDRRGAEELLSRLSSGGG